MSTIAQPKNLTDANERPAQSLPEPSWTENYCFVCYDPTTEIGLWTHLGRAPFDQSTWRDLTMIYLPSGERLVSKGYGRTEAENGPGSGCMTFRCEEPWNRWRMQRDGNVLRTTEAALDVGLMADGPQERAAFDLAVTGRLTPWDWGDVEDEHGWGKLHYEQLCDVTGSVTIGGETVAFNGQGLRDHTRGPRDFTVFSKHIWAWANFPSGRGFILLQLIVAGQELARTVVYEVDGGQHPVVLRNRPLLGSRAEGRDPYVLDLGDDGTVEAELIHTLPNGFAGANDICIGYDTSVTEAANFESFTRFTWGGEVGYGLTQRAIKER